MTVKELRHLLNSVSSIRDNEEVVAVWHFPMSVDEVPSAYVEDHDEQFTTTSLQLAYNHIFLVIHKFGPERKKAF